MSFIGYARVSMEDQNLGLQLDALQAAGCEAVFQDTVSGASTGRKGLADALDRPVAARPAARHSRKATAPRTRAPRRPRHRAAASLETFLHTPLQSLTNIVISRP